MKKGFTLVEVVMTLAIIGVIAAITIPTMIHETNKKATIEQLKKSAATLNQAVYNATITSGTVMSWDWSSKESVLEIMQRTITPRLNAGYMCSGDVTGMNTQCTYKITSLSGEEIANEEFETKSRVLLNDGSLVAFSKGFFSEQDVEESKKDESGASNASGTDCTWGGNPKAVCGIFMVDVNGNKKPNVVGKDVFFFGLNLSGAVLPYGADRSGNYIDENCAEDSIGSTCAAKLAKDGWDVCYTGCSNPYPLRF